MNLVELRNQIRAARNAIPSSTRVHWSEQICDRVKQLDAFKSSKKLAAFLAFDGEADPIRLMRHAVKQGKQVFVPIIVGKSKPLQFAPWNPDCEMRENRFGILEPAVPKSDWIEPDQLDFVVTPLVAFDEHCNRIGVGGGYYDRSFAFLNEQLNRSVSLVGFAFELQKVSPIESQTWDVAMDLVVTESREYTA